MPVRGYIDLRRALKNFLKEHGVTLMDVLSIMDALRMRVHLNPAQSRRLERNLSSGDLNTPLFVIQTFYILNPSSLYKGS